MLNGAVFGSTSLSAYARTDIFITKLKNNYIAKESRGAETIVLDGQISESNVVLNWPVPEKTDSIYYLIEKGIDSTTK